MVLRETLLLQNSSAGMVFNTGLASWARILVLLIAVGAFILSLSSDFAYDPRFRIAVILLAIFMGVFVGPRTEVLIIQDERKIKITKRFFIFSRSNEYNLDGSEELSAQGKKILLNKAGHLLVLAETRKENTRNLWLEGIRQCLERMRFAV
jgi:hypothetical protein